MNVIAEEMPVVVGERVPFHRVAQANLLTCERHYRGARIEVLQFEDGYVDAEVFACCPAFAYRVRAELAGER